jgi:hypothetical protein
MSKIKKPAKKSSKKSATAKSATHFDKLWTAVEELAYMTTKSEAGNIPAPIIKFFADGLAQTAAAFCAVMQENNPGKKRK